MEKFTNRIYQQQMLAAQRADDHIIKVLKKIKAAGIENLSITNIHGDWIIMCQSGEDQKKVIKFVMEVEFEDKQNLN